MELHRLRASQVSAAQPLNIIYHRRQKLSNGFLVVLIVYAFLLVVILFILKYTTLQVFEQKMPYETLWCIISLHIKLYERSDLI